MKLILIVCGEKFIFNYHYVCCNEIIVKSLVKNKNKRYRFYMNIVIGKMRTRNFRSYHGGFAPQPNQRQDSVP